jgi:hypothetical protein
VTGWARSRNSGGALHSSSNSLDGRENEKVGVGIMGLVVAFLGLGSVGVINMGLLLSH